MASPKIPWNRLWQALWKTIPCPQTDGRLLLALDDSINPKTGKKIFGCDNVFDHAAKQNQSRYPWAQNIVAIGLLKIVKGRWACLPLNYRFYHMKKSIEKMNRTFAGAKIEFQSKLEQAADMITDIAETFDPMPIITITDSWFGNNGLYKPLEIRIAGRSVDYRAVRANIQRMHAENPAATVVIKANPQSSNKTLVRVMDASRQAGVYNIALAETEH